MKSDKNKRETAAKCQMDKSKRCCDIEAVMSWQINMLNVVFLTPHSCEDQLVYADNLC